MIHIRLFVCLFVLVSRWERCDLTRVCVDILALIVDNQSVSNNCWRGKRPKMEHVASTFLSFCFFFNNEMWEETRRRRMGPLSIKLFGRWGKIWLKMTPHTPVIEDRAIWETSTGENISTRPSSRIISAVMTISASCCIKYESIQKLCTHTHTHTLTHTHTHARWWATPVWEEWHLLPLFLSLCLSLLPKKKYIYWYIDIYNVVCWSER